MKCPIATHAQWSLKNAINGKIIPHDGLAANNPARKIMLISVLMARTTVPKFYPYTEFKPF